MMNNLLRTLNFTLLLALLSVPAWAQVGRMEGEVKGVDGQPMRNAVIQIHRTDQTGEYEVKTNKKGRFMHAGLPYGMYNAALMVDGEQKDQVENIRIGANGALPVDFDLQALAERQATLQEQANAGAEPTEDQMAGMSPKERKAYEEALAKRQEQLEKNKGLNDAFNAGMLALKSEDYASAVESLKEAAALTETQDVVFGNYGEALAGLALTKTGEERTALMNEAVTAYSKAMEINPAQAGYANNLGLALIQAERTDEGMAMLEKAVAADPANGGKYYFNVGAILTNSGDTDGAIAAFRKATEVQPDYANAYFQLATSLVGKATFTPDGSMVPVDGTIQAFEKYLELQPNGADSETAKAMLASLTTTVDTTFKQGK